MANWGLLRWDDDAPWRSLAWDDETAQAMANVEIASQLTEISTSKLAQLDIAGIVGRTAIPPFTLPVVWDTPVSDVVGVGSVSDAERIKFFKALSVDDVTVSSSVTSIATTFLRQLDVTTLEAATAVTVIALEVGWHLQANGITSDSAVSAVARDVIRGINAQDLLSDIDMPGPALHTLVQTALNDLQIGSEVTSPGVSPWNDLVIQDVISAGTVLTSLTLDAAANLQLLSMFSPSDVTTVAASAFKLLGVTDAAVISELTALVLKRLYGLAENNAAADSTLTSPALTKHAALGVNNFQADSSLTTPTATRVGILASENIGIDSVVQDITATALHSLSVENVVSDIDQDLIDMVRVKVFAYPSPTVSSEVTSPSCQAVRNLNANDVAAPSACDSIDYQGYWYRDALDVAIRSAVTAPEMSGWDNYLKFTDETLYFTDDPLSFEGITPFIENMTYRSEIEAPVLTRVAVFTEEILDLEWSTEVTEPTLIRVALPEPADLPIETEITTSLGVRVALPEPASFAIETELPAPILTRVALPISNDFAIDTEITVSDSRRVALPTSNDFTVPGEITTPIPIRVVPHWIDDLPVAGTALTQPVLTRVALPEPADVESPSTVESLDYTPIRWTPPTNVEAPRALCTDIDYTAIRGVNATDLVSEIAIDPPHYARWPLTFTDDELYFGGTPLTFRPDKFLRFINDVEAGVPEVTALDAHATRHSETDNITAGTAVADGSGVRVALPEPNDFQADSELTQPTLTRVAIFEFRDLPPVSSEVETLAAVRVVLPEPVSFSVGAALTDVDSVRVALPEPVSFTMATALTSVAGVRVALPEPSSITAATALTQPTLTISGLTFTDESLYFTDEPLDF